MAPHTLALLFHLATSVSSPGTTGGNFNFEEAQAAEQPAPSSPLQGIDLVRVSSYVVSVCRTSGNLVGGEKLVPYRWSEKRARWVAVPDNTLTVTNPEGSCTAWPDTEVAVLRGRGYWAARGFGATVTVVVEGRTW